MLSLFSVSSRFEAKWSANKITIRLQSSDQQENLSTDLLMWIDESHPNWAVHAAKI